MSQINSITDGKLLPPVNSPKETTKTGSESFEKALNQAFSKSEQPPPETGAADSLSEIASISPAGLIDSIDSSDLVSGKTEGLLDLLDAYSAKLDNPEVSLKSIAPVLEALNSNADTLLQETRNLTSADDALKKIATEAAVTAQTEYLKFQRGDYVS